MEREVGSARLVVRHAVVLAEAVELRLRDVGLAGLDRVHVGSASSRFPGAVQATTHSPVSGLGLATRVGAECRGEVVPEPDVVGLLARVLLVAGLRGRLGERDDCVTVLARVVARARPGVSSPQLHRL